MGNKDEKVQKVEKYMKKYHCLGVTPKHWQTPKSWWTPVENMILIN